MSTTMTEKAMAMTAAREICTRPWMGSNTAHAVDLRTVQGRSVPVAGIATGDLVVTDGRFSGVATAPTTGYVYPRLEAPPV
jgi:hypothetical protein